MRTAMGGEDQEHNGIHNQTVNRMVVVVRLLFSHYNLNIAFQPVNFF